MTQAHTQDADCVLGADGCCTSCGVTHAQPCETCGGRGFHKPCCDDGDRRTLGAVHGTAVQRYPNGHRLSPVDAASGRVRCTCGAPAKFCEYNRWNTGNTSGISFWQWCTTCWIKPGPMGTTPKERVMQSKAVQ